MQRIFILVCRNKRIRQSLRQETFYQGIELTPFQRIPFRGKFLLYPIVESLEFCIEIRLGLGNSEQQRKPDAPPSYGAGSVVSSSRSRNPQENMACTITHCNNRNSDAYATRYAK